MDRVFSTRIGDKTIRRIRDLSGRLHTSQKFVVEHAVELLEHKIDTESVESGNVFDRTSGAWKRKAAPSRTISTARAAFRESMERHAR